MIDHPAPAGGGTTVYGHMWDAFATGLKPGSSVSAGQHIAYVGSNGQSSGPHLHFEVHPTVWRAGSQIDPMPWPAGALDPETMLTVAAVPLTDTLYADVSEWQRPVDDSYPYRVIAIRSNDGTYRTGTGPRTTPGARDAATRMRWSFSSSTLSGGRTGNRPSTRSKILSDSAIHEWP